MKRRSGNRSWRRCTPRGLSAVGQIATTAPTTGCCGVRKQAATPTRYNYSFSSVLRRDELCKTMASNGDIRGGELPHTDAYVELSLLDGGSFIGDLSRVHAGASGKYRMYNWAFHVQHEGRHLLWDLGLDEVRKARSASSACSRRIAGPFELHSLGAKAHACRDQSCRAPKNTGRTAGGQTCNG